jgi:shikimate kinase
METRAETPPTLVFLIGPPAVGKMTVGQELARRTGFHLLHNHQINDLVSDFFPFGTPAFNCLVRSYRNQFFDAAAQNGLNLITTGSWAFDEPETTDVIRRFVEPYTAAGQVYFVELLAPLDVILERNRTENRRRNKKTDWATDEYLRQMHAEHQFDSGDVFPLDLPHLRLKTEHLSAEATAERIRDYFGLRSVP